MNIQTTARLILSLSLAAITGGFALTAAAAATPAQKTAAAPAESLRPEVARHLLVAQEKIKAGQFREALLKFADVDLIANKTPYEIFIMERMRGTAALAVGEHAISAKSFETIIASGRLDAADHLLYSEAIASAHYNLKDYKPAADWAARSIKAGGTKPQTRMLLIQALFLADDFTSARTEINAAIAADEKDGKTVPEELLKMLGRTALKQNEPLVYIDALEKLILQYPNKLYWADFISRIANKPGITDRYMQDIFRLQLALGEKLTASQYLFLAQSAMQAGFPIDARQVLDMGFAAAVLGASAEHKQLRDKADKDALDDIKNMPRLTAEAEKSREGPGLFNAGLNHVYNGDREKGIAMMEQGIKRAGIKRPEDARLRLGITYALSGEHAMATEVLASVAGTEGIADVARLWRVFAKQAIPARAAN